MKLTFMRVIVIVVVIAIVVNAPGQELSAFPLPPFSVLRSALSPRRLALRERINYLAKQ